MGRDTAKPLTAYYVHGAADECWPWTGGGNRFYGVYRLPGCPRSSSMMMAHRAVYEGLVGPIPDCLELHHTCENKRCVNPAHMEPISHRDHLRKHLRRDNTRLLCRQGHQYVPGNIYVRPDGDIECQTCRRAARQRFRNIRVGIA